MSYGVTTEGFKVKPRAVILEELNAKYKARFGNSFDVTPESLDGQKIGLVADAIHESYLREELAYSNFIPSKSFGAGLDGLVELNGIKRVSGESDAQLRARRARNTISQGTSTANAIYEAVANLNLNFVAIRENDTNATLATGQPPHSIHVIADGGDDTAIATAIYSNISGGATQAWGATTISISDIKGYPHTIGFDRPTNVTIEVEVKLKQLAGSSNDSVEDVQKVLSKYINSLNISEDVIWSSLFAPIFTIPLVEVTELKVRRQGGAYATASVDIAAAEKAVATVANITVIEV